MCLHRRAEGVEGGVCSLSVCGPMLIRTHKGRADNTGHFLSVQEQQGTKDKGEREEGGKEGGVQLHSRKSEILSK